MDAVARRFSATWQEDSGPANAVLTVAGKRVAVALTCLKPRGFGQPDAPRVRLRFDKVATRFLETLQASIGDNVPKRTTVLVTITAPIRLASKTAAALHDKIQSLLRRGSVRRDETDTIHGNGIRIRIVRHESDRAPKLIGFVHNPDSDPVLLLDLTGEALEFSGARAGKKKAMVDRWLVIGGGSIPCLEAYRYIYSRLRVAMDFSKILMISADGRVEMLTE